MSFLPIEDLLLFRSTSKQAKEESESHWDLRLCEMAIQIENLKLD